jgi:hypothetical protein
VSVRYGPSSVYSVVRRGWSYTLTRLKSLLRSIRYAHFYHLFYLFYNASNYKPVLA